MKLNLESKKKRDAQKPIFPYKIYMEKFWCQKTNNMMNMKYIKNI